MTINPAHNRRDNLHKRLPADSLFSLASAIRSLRMLTIGVQ